MLDYGHTYVLQGPNDRGKPCNQIDSKTIRRCFGYD